MLRSDSPRQVNPQQARLLEYRSLIHPATLQQQEPRRSMLVLGTVESCCHQFFPNSVSQWGLQPRIAQVQRGSRGSSEGSGEGSRKPWCKAKSGSTGFRRKSGRLWCRAKSGSTGFRRRFRRRSGRLWCKAWCEPGHRNIKKGGGDG